MLGFLEIISQPYNFGLFTTLHGKYGLRCVGHIAHSKGIVHCHSNEEHFKV